MKLKLISLGLSFLHKKLIAKNIQLITKALQTNVLVSDDSEPQTDPMCPIPFPQNDQPRIT
jgi:hypothetical protein